MDIKSEIKMGKDKLLEELVNHVVKSTHHVIMVDPTTMTPTSGGSGCLIIYKERLFFISVQHVTDQTDRQAAIDTGTGNEYGTNIFSLPALNFVDQYNLAGLEIGEPTLQQLKSLDICYTEITDDIEIKQKQKVFGNIVVSADSKRMIYSNLDYEPTKEEGYSFHGRIKGELKGNTLNQTDELVLGIKYDRKIGPYEKFILEDKIIDELDFKGTSGAPIFSETGEPVALVAHGYIGENYLYGFSVRELRKYIDIYIDLNPTQKLVTEEIDMDFSIDTKAEFTNYDLGETDEASGRPVTKFNNDFNFKNIVNPKYISYPILYGTNRTYEIKNNNIEFGNTRDNKLHLGSCEISIPLSHEMGEIERPNWFSRLLFAESPKKYFTILNNELIEVEKFTNLLSEKIVKSDENDGLLFIHGFNVDFKEAMLRAAQLGYDLNFKGCVTAFSWPSVGTIGGYVADTDTARLSSNYLCDFIKKILQTNTAKKLHIIAHSMGNVVLTNALIDLKNEGAYPNDIINQIILAAPDIDKDIFIHQIMPEINRNYGLTLYASDKDKALITAKKIRIGYSRLGEGGNDIVVVDGLDSVDASKVDTSLLGHGYFANTQALLNDIHMTLLGLPPTSRILESKNKDVDGQTKLYWVFRKS